LFQGEKKMAEVERPEVKEKKKGRNWVAPVIGFAAGSVVGAVTALLYAPQSGKETREKIKERVSEVSDKAGALIEQSREAIEDAKEKMTHAYEDAVDRTSSVISQAKEKLGAKKKDLPEE